MKYAEIEWNKGTPRNTCYDDVYFSADNGLQETEFVFLKQNELPQRWRQADRFVIAETGFGTGLNLFATMKQWLQHAPAHAGLHYISIEHQPVAPSDIARLAGRWPELQPLVDELLLLYPPPVPGMHRLDLADGRVRLHLIFDDVEAALEQIDHKADAWFLDGFAPARNEAMWSRELMEQVFCHTLPGGSFATYTAAGWVRRNLQAAGFTIEKRPGFAGKRDMTIGWKGG